VNADGAEWCLLARMGAGTSDGLLMPASFLPRRGRPRLPSCASQSRHRSRPAGRPWLQWADSRWLHAYPSPQAQPPVTRPLSAGADRNVALRHTRDPSQPLTRRLAAHRLQRPSSPIRSRPPGESTRAISPTARAASSAKQTTVTASTRSKLPSGNDRARTSPCNSWTATPLASACARPAASMRGSASTPVTMAPRFARATANAASPHPTSRMRRPDGGLTRWTMSRSSRASVMWPSRLERQRR
jgi:hypothetical protein